MSTMQEKILEKSNIPKGEKRDLNKLYGDMELMTRILDIITEPYVGKVDYIASPESLGFILGSMVATKLGVGFIPIRNKELYALSPENALSAPYIDHRNLPRTLQVRQGIIPAGSRILLVDDWVETAATIHACAAIVEDADAKVVGVASVGVSYNDKTKEMIESKTLTSVVVFEK